MYPGGSGTLYRAPGMALACAATTECSAADAAGRGCCAPVMAAMAAMAFMDRQGAINPNMIANDAVRHRRLRGVKAAIALPPNECRPDDLCRIVPDVHLREV